MKAYVHGKTVREDGREDSFYTREAEVEERPLRHHTQGLSYTATGYGKKIPTVYVVKFNGKWRRVYCRCYSNTGTLYLGDIKPTGERLNVQIERA